MKLPILLSLLFIITISFGAVHEIEHIGQDHVDNSCEVCIVDNNTVSADIVPKSKYVKFLNIAKILQHTITFNVRTTHKNYYSRAPPILC